jgi:hypothetical protein
MMGEESPLNCLLIRRLAIDKPMRPHRLRSLMRLAMPLAAVALVIGHPAFVVCSCAAEAGAQSACQSAHTACCCSNKSGAASATCPCKSSGNTPAPDRTCGCAAPRELAASTGPRADESRSADFLPAFGVLSICFTLGGYASTFSSTAVLAGGPPGRRLHALLSVWRN